jgi:hypothetical protein
VHCPIHKDGTFRINACGDWNRCETTLTVRVVLQVLSAKQEGSGLAPEAGSLRSDVLNRNTSLSGFVLDAVL